MNNSKTIKDDDPCPCGSGKTYIKCCWIRDALREKKEKSRIPFEDLKEATKEKVFQSREELQSFTDNMMDRYNREPDEDFLGLSSEQMARLLHFPLEDNADIVQLNKDISLQLYEKAPIVRNTQIFLSALAEAEPLKATAKGNLPVKFAKTLFDEIEDSRFKEWIRFRSEEDSIKVLSLRHILKIGGWIKKEKKYFKLTRRGKDLLNKGFSEEHFYRLLLTFTTKFNWGFQDRYPEFWIIQGSWLFSLFLLHKKAKTYTEDITVARDFIKAFPEVALEVDEIYISAFEYITRCFSLRFLERLCEYFGFVKARRDKQQDPFSESLFVKTSPFFEKYITWNIQ